jgi:hypothetical protein
MRFLLISYLENDDLAPLAEEVDNQLAAVCRGKLSLANFGNWRPRRGTDNTYPASHGLAGVREENWQGSARSQKGFSLINVFFRHPQPYPANRFVGAWYPDPGPGGYEPAVFLVA